MSKSSQAFRTIREVADWLDVAAHVLRFWESKFPQIKPVKRAGGRRYYRPSDMEIVGGIKVLLHDRGLTIRGVQKLIREDGVAAVAALSPPIDPLLGEDTIDGEAADWVKEAEAETLAAEPATPDPEPLQPEPSAEAEEDTSDQAVLPFAIDASAEDAEEAEEKDATAEVPAPEEAAARVGDETDVAPAAGMPAAVDPDEVIPGVALIQLCTWVAETDRLAKVDPATLETAVDALRALRDRMRADPETSAA